MTVIIETDRLILRTWEEKDIEPYFLINQDPKVLKYLASPLTPKQSRNFIESMNAQQDKKNYTLWAVEIKKFAKFIGFIGLNHTDFDAPLCPAVEIGWRLDSQHWGNGYAPEGAKACLDYGFNKIGLKEIVSFTVPSNVNSLKVMEKIGLKRDFRNNFDHPKLSQDHPLSKHVLYRLTKDDFLKQTSPANAP